MGKLAYRETKYGIINILLFTEIAAPTPQKLLKEH